MMPEIQKTIKCAVKHAIRYAPLTLLLLLSRPCVLQAAPAAAPVIVSDPMPQEVFVAQEQTTVSLNHASVEQLASQLKGIGRKRAEAIVHYRETHGPFVSLEQLTEVPGIGNSVLEQNRQRLTL